MQVGIDALDGRVPRHVDLEAGGIEDLRHQTEVGHGRLVAVAEGAGLAVVANRGLVGLEAGLDPVTRPGESALLGLPELLAQILHHPQVLDGMDIGGADQRQGPHAGAVDRILGQQRRLGMRLLEIFQDGQRLGQHLARIEHQGRHQLLRIERDIVGRRLLALAQMARSVLDLDALEIERDTHAKRRRRTKIADELHDRLRGHLSTAYVGGV